MAADLLARIEDAGLNASAPPQQRVLDGWLLRFSPGKAKRARCVNAIGVGGVATKSLEVVLTDETLRREFDANTPMKRPGTPEDIAAAALYFASPASSWVTGKLLHVDGGTERPSACSGRPRASSKNTASVERTTTRARRR